MPGFPTAGDELPEEMAELVRRIAELWVSEPSRPRPNPGVTTHWDGLITDWRDDPTLPLLIRRFSRNRGTIITHASGRTLVPVDNSPAQWTFALAVMGQTPSLDQVREWIDGDQVPIAMMMSASERTTAVKRCPLGKSVYPNRRGWKVAHIEPVGLTSNLPLVDQPIAALETHFLRLMSPRNMFAIPLRYAGLGELPEFCEAMLRQATIT
jgi:hypothetical protein